MSDELTNEDISLLMEILEDADVFMGVDGHEQRNVVYRKLKNMKEATSDRKEG